MQLKPRETKNICIKEGIAKWDVHLCRPILWNLIKSGEPTYDRYAYEVLRDHRDKIILKSLGTMAGESSDTMASFSFKHLAVKSKVDSPVQWVLAQHSQSSAVFLCFRGTIDMEDAMAGLCTAPSFETSHGVGVHSGWVFEVFLTRGDQQKGTRYLSGMFGVVAWSW